MNINSKILIISICGISSYLKRDIQWVISICSCIYTRNTSDSGFQRKKMYWNLPEWSMSNPRKFPHYLNYFIFFNFIQLEIALPPNRHFGCRIKMKWGNFRGLLIDHSGKFQYIDEVWFCLLFYHDHSWKTIKNVKC
jgi:hypothetical protein